MAFTIDTGGSGAGGHRIGGALSEINIIPLVDVTLVLLLIFMLTAPLMYRGIDVNLPKTSGKPTVTEERMVLTLTKEQTIYLNDKPVPLATLEQHLRDMFKNRQDKTLYLRADQALQYGLVVETMDRVRRAGIEKLGMVTEPTPTRAR
jgi:biopolymer transport protein TolR